MLQSFWGGCDGIFEPLEQGVFLQAKVVLAYWALRPPCCVYKYGQSLSSWKHGTLLLHKCIPIAFAGTLLASGVGFGSGSVQGQPYQIQKDVFARQVCDSRPTGLLLRGWLQCQCHQALVLICILLMRLPETNAAQCLHPEIPSTKLPFLGLFWTER